MKQVALSAAVMTALALPAAAQTVAATSSTTASSAVLVTSQQTRTAQDLREARVLADAAFERPPALLRISTRPAAAYQAPPLEPKEEWTSDQGLRMKGALLRYKARF